MMNNLTEKADTMKEEEVKRGMKEEEVKKDTTEETEEEAMKEVKAGVDTEMTEDILNNMKI